MHTIQSIQQYVSALYADKVTGRVPGLVIQSYSYPITRIVGLAPAGVATQQLNMQANSDFLCLEIEVHASIASAAQTVNTETLPMVSLLVTDSGSNQQWTNAAVDVTNWCTVGNRKNPLNFPRLTQGRSSLTLNFTSLAAAETYTLAGSLNGVLIFLLG